MMVMMLGPRDGDDDVIMMWRLWDHDVMVMRFECGGGDDGSMMY